MRCDPITILFAILSHRGGDGRRRNHGDPGTRQASPGIVGAFAHVGGLPAGAPGTPRRRSVQLWRELA